MQGTLDVEVDDTVMTNLGRVLTKRALAHIACVEHVVVSEVDGDRILGKEFLYVVATDEAFYMIKRNDVVQRSKRPKLQTPIPFEDVLEVEVPAAGPDIFDDAQINKRSMQVFITYCPPPPAAKTERKRIRVVTFARQAKIAFYLERMWMNAGRVRRRPAHCLAPRPLPTANALDRGRSGKRRATAPACRTAWRSGWIRRKTRRPSRTG